MPVMMPCAIRVGSTDDLRACAEPCALVNREQHQERRSDAPSVWGGNPPAVPEAAFVDRLVRRRPSRR